MSFFDKVMKSAGQAAETVKGEVKELQTKNEIVRTYENLGRKVYELADKGQLSHDDVTPYVDRIRDLKDKLETMARAGWDTEQQAPPDAEAPPDA